MKTYIVTITKYGSMAIEAPSEEYAEEMARDMESEGGFFMEMEVEVVEAK